VALEKSLSNAAFTTGVTFSGSGPFANELMDNSITIAVKTILIFFITILFVCFRITASWRQLNYNSKVAAGC
jgi:hypothetical protein